MKKNSIFYLAIILGILVGNPLAFCSKGSLPFFFFVPKEGEKVPEYVGPWFTGPLLAPSGHVVPGGYFNFEPYVFANVFTGVYNKHWHSQSAPKFYNANFELSTQIGLTNWMDVQIIPQASYNSTRGVSSLQVNDFPIQLDFQLLLDNPDNYVPGIKFSIRETFPLGKFQNLDPERLGTDVGGAGSYATTFSFVVTRLFHFSSVYYLSLRLFPFYTIFAPFHVRKFNAYGGAENTRGRIFLGNQFGAIFGMELSLSQNWAFAFDAFANYTNKSHFYGKQGSVTAPIAKPSSFQFSIAPAIEYNFSAAIGVIAGAWFTLAGRNTSVFANGVIAVNYYGPFSNTPKERKTIHRKRTIHRHTPLPSPGGSG